MLRIGYVFDTDLISGQPELPLTAPVRRLVLNDNGPQLAEEALQRIRSYAGQPAAFATVSESPSP